MKKDNAELNLKRGKRLKYERTQRGMTQEQLAELSNYSVQHISYIENGNRKLGYEAANIFSKILGVSVSYLMYETDLKSSPSDSPFDSNRLTFLFSNIFSIFLEYDYDLVGISFPTIGFIDKEIATRSKEDKIEILSKICVNQKIGGQFIFEFSNLSKEVSFFYFMIKTPLDNIIEIKPDDLYECISNIIQYSQLQFLNLGSIKSDIFNKLEPICKSKQKGYFYITKDDSNKAPGTN